jgi:hypothetical protein
VLELPYSPEAQCRGLLRLLFLRRRTMSVGPGGAGDGFARNLLLVAGLLFTEIAHASSARQKSCYRYGHDHVPHDARVRELGTGRTRVETLFALGRKPTLVPDHKLEDGINAARRCLPRVWFHRNRCAAGLEALRQYRADYDERSKVFKDKPRHDWTSHAADAFRYLAMAWQERARPQVAPAKPLFKPMDEITWDEFEEIDQSDRQERL